jgi:hypothetical protein
MGLTEIIDITETVTTDSKGQLQDALEVQFLTENTSGVKTVTLSAADFSVDRARAEARDKAQQLDQLTGGEVE